MRKEELRALALRVKEVRAGKNLTQERVADLSGLHVTYIAGIEGARRNPSFLSLTVLAKGLGVSLSELVKGLDD